MQRHFQTEGVKVMGHRGSGGSHPENTLASFEAAIAAGSHFVEMDVRCTRDGVAVLFHDDVLVRTVRRGGKVDETDAGIRFGDLDWSDARGLDVGSWKHERFGGERPPSLSEAAEVCKGRAVIVLDLKQDGIGSAIARGLQDAGVGDGDVVLGAWNEAQARDLRAAMPGHPMTLIGTPSMDETWFDAALGMGVTGVHMDWRKLSAEFVQRARSRGLVVSSWTVNEEEDMRRAIAMGVQAICTDHPELCAGVVASDGDPGRIERSGGNNPRGRGE